MKYLVMLAFTSACAQKIKIEPVKVEPIHMTIDVNLRDEGTPRLAKPPR